MSNSNNLLKNLIEKVRAARIKRIAKNYLQCLYKHGYFELTHENCDGTHIENHPACRNASTYEMVQICLTENHWVRFVQGKMEVFIKDGGHIREIIDLWWYEITDKGKALIVKGTPLHRKK